MVRRRCFGTDAQQNPSTGVWSAMPFVDVIRFVFVCALVLAQGSRAEGRLKVMVLNLTASERDLQPLADSLSESVLTELQ
ncbi:MAG: hypothetical protein JNM69_01825, partial [Archangium sp.]|nr:hypothetical protein [Archangium sp.]